MSAFNLIVEFVGSAVVSAVCSIGVVKWFANTTRDRWMEAVKADYDAKLEQLKDQLLRGAYISKAQWDVELSSYRELWERMGQLRNDCRSLLSSRMLPTPDKDREGEYYKKAFSTAMAAFHNAHNEAVLSTDRHAPFYPETIKKAAQAVTAADMDVIRFYSSDRGWFTDAWFCDLEELVRKVTCLIEVAESAIRSRLSSVRIQT